MDIEEQYIIGSLRPRPQWLAGVAVSAPHMVERLRGRRGVKQRRLRLERTNRLCERCLGINRWQGKGTGRVTPATVVNHIVPLSLGGSDDDENTENLCADCDRIITAQQFGFRRKREIGLDGWPTT